MSSSRYKEERQYPMYTSYKGVEEYKSAVQFRLLENILQSIIPRYEKISLPFTSITTMNTLYRITSEISKLLNDLQ